MATILTDLKKLVPGRVGDVESFNKAFSNTCKMPSIIRLLFSLTSILGAIASLLAF